MRAHRVRRRASVGAAVSLAALAAACSGGSNESGATAPARPKTVSGTVVMAEPGDNPGDLALRNTLAQDFMKTHPKIAVKILVVPGTNYDQKVQTMIAGGKAPDIFGSGDVQIPNIVQKNFALDLTSYVKRDRYSLADFYPQIIQNLTYDGKLVGLTDNWDTEVMYYNTSLFKQAGVAPPTDNWTWDDFVAAARKLTSGSGPNKTYGAVYDNWFGPYYDQIWMNGGDPYPNGKSCGYDSPAAVKAFGQITELYQDGLSPTPAEFKGSGAEQVFITGKAAMLIGEGRWAAYDLRNVKKFGWKIAPLPTGSAGRANFFHIGMYAIARGSKNPEAAWEFLKYMVSPAGIKVGLSAEQGVPSRRSIAASAAFQHSAFADAHNTVQPFVTSLPTVHRAPNLSNFSQVQDTADAQLAPMWSLKATPAAALSNVCAKVKPLLSAGSAAGGG